MLLLSARTGPVMGQDSIPRPRVTQGRQIPSQDQILERLRQSGYSREQVRQRLQLAGYDPALADRYFDELARRDSSAAGTLRVGRLAEPLPKPSGALVDALSSIGLLMSREASQGDSLFLARDAARPPAPPRRVITEAPQVFGKELFSATTTQFQPVLEGPVDPDYRLGPGDELTIMLTGEVEVGYNLPVSREGYIVIPDVGQVLVAGLTLEGLKARLNNRLARAYSGLTSGRTQFDLTVGALRRNLIRLVGEVNLPGAYPTPGGATVFNALYQAGGPNDNGSYRAIDVRRDNRVIRTVDLYDYLTRGDRGNDIRLEQGDIVFVPVVGKQVTLTGNVRRSAIYELLEGEMLSDLLRFAGGVGSSAALDRIQIDRILPPAERQPGHERVIVDVALDSRPGVGVALQDGDHVTVLAISNERRNRVKITGDVRRPGDYEYQRSMSVQDLVNSARGLMSTAYTPSAHVVRLNPADSSIALVQVSFDDTLAANHANKVRLEDLDEVVVFGRAQLRNPELVEIFGMVKSNGGFPFAEGMTAQDLILLAGGFRTGAVENEAEIARRITGQPGTLARTERAPIALGLSDGSTASGQSGYLLQPGDQVFIRRRPDFEPLTTSDVVGEVVYPGPYTMQTKAERVSHVIRRAGGLTTDAYVPGFRLVRGDLPVGVDLARALAQPGSEHDVLIEPGDRLEVPRYDATVLVVGAVAVESRVRFERGLSVDDYLARAGGIREDGDKSRVAVRYQNGELRTASHFLGLRRSPQVEPGSTISVPFRAKVETTNWEQVFTRSLSFMSALATLVLAVRALQ